MAELVASIIVAPLVDAIFSNVASLLKEEIVAIRGVKKELDKLKSNLSAIRAVLVDAEQKQLDSGSHSLRDWLKKLKDAASYAEDILDTFATETFLWKRKQQVRKVKSLSFASKLRFKSSVAHKIKEISERFDVITKEKNDFHHYLQENLPQTTYGGRPQNFPQTSSSVDATGVFGRVSDREKLIKYPILSNESAAAAKGDVSVTPIVGMGGLGKTTLAQLIFNDERVKNHFESRMWVCVTAEFNYHRILKDMLEFHTTMNLSNLSLETLESRLKFELSGKMFLLVLDDVWTENTQIWNQLETLLKLGSQDSRVLVTTRKIRVSEIVGTEPPCTLESLPDKECWSLFKNKAFTNCNDLDLGLMKELEGIGRKIVEKCNGLPLAVSVMGGLLRGNFNVSKWNQILKSSIWELDKKGENFDRPRILPALKLSYDHIHSNYKQCFAYCSVFPKSYVFDKKDLVKLWMAQSFIQPSSEQTVEESGIEYFDELLGMSFFQNFKIDEKERYRMHDLIHDLAVSVSTPQCCHVNDNNSSSFSEESRHVSLICSNLEKPALRITEESEKLRLRTLLLPGDHLRSFGQTQEIMFQALDKMFRSLKYIRVLDLSSGGLLELPSSIEELKLLRYLDLSRNEIEVLPNSICKLCNLQTLKLLGCPWLFELPKDLGDMVNLHYLELDDMFWYKCRTLPPSMGKLTNLRNLHEFPVTSTIGHGIEELKGMANLTGTLCILNLENAVNAAEAELNKKERLQKLVLEWSDREFNQEEEAKTERDLKDLQPHANLQELALLHYKGSNFPSWMTDGLLQKIVTLSLSHCTKCTTLSVSQLPCLRVLNIKGMLELEEWPEDQCLSLYRLKISNCPKLREIPKFMPNLRVLKAKKCDLLKALPVAPSLTFLVLIDNFALEDWMERMCIVQDDQGNLQPRLTLVGLLEMKVENSRNMQALPKAFFPQKLEISGCGLITALPPPQHAQRLQHLALGTCSDGTLVRAIPSTNSLYSLVISNISNLTFFPKLPHLPGLKSLYVNDCEDLTSLSEEEGSLKSLSSLKSLCVQRCPKLDSFPDEGLPTNLEHLEISSCGILKSLGSKQTLKSLISLKDLCLENCPLIQSFPEDGLPSSLQHLKIHDCKLLTEQCQENAAEWPKIMHVTDREIGP